MARRVERATPQCSVPPALAAAAVRRMARRVERATPQCSVPPALAALARTDVVQSGERAREREEREGDGAHARRPLAARCEFSLSTRAPNPLYCVSPVRWSHLCLPTFGIAGSGGTYGSRDIFCSVCDKSDQK